jgi:hypothetical protein
MTLFESNPQYREKLTIWRVLSLLPLYGPLAEGHIWRWFAINIPMDIGAESNEHFTSDIDLIAKLHDFPNSHEWIYKTWEVKVSLLHRDGRVSSLKAGKTKRTITQLKAYRNFGAPEVTLLDINVCEDGFLLNNQYPPEELIYSSHKKAIELNLEGFGYQILPFEHGKNGEEDIGLMAFRNSPFVTQTAFNILPSHKFGFRQPFSRLVDDINKFHENLGDIPRKSLHQIIYCKNCRQFQLIDMKRVQNCPNCKDDLIIQT